MSLLKIFFCSFSMEVFFLYVWFICIVFFIVLTDLRCSVHIIDLSFSLSEYYDCFTLSFSMNALSFLDLFCWLFSTEHLFDFMDFSFPVFQCDIFKYFYFIIKFHFNSLCLFLYFIQLFFCALLESIQKFISVLFDFIDHTYNHSLEFLF